MVIIIKGNTAEIKAYKKLVENPTDNNAIRKFDRLFKGLAGATIKKYEELDKAENAKDFNRGAGK